MKKYFLGVILLFLLSGCTAEYTLKIDDITDKVYDETLQVKSSDLDEISSIYKSNILTNAYDDEDYDSESNEKIEGVSYYDVHSYYANGSYIVDYHFAFPSERFNHAAGIRAGFYDFSKTYNEEENTITLDTGYFSYDKFPDLEKLTVNIIIDNEVISHNANSVSGNVYKWEITDFENARLILTYKNEQPNETGNNDTVVIITVCVCMVLLVIFIVAIRKVHLRNYR